eukprot:TRINITY_DN7517_c0_g1_i1.p1 TRINITY_DN7517_c0_g1~~TRINITY_DN7517_c0_g1_i1.p1  ORF type:complete len:397 (+),score=95.28 TRINITY_DN7517_c0_g1_i1:40-1230(+)
MLEEYDEGVEEGVVVEGGAGEEGWGGDMLFGVPDDEEVEVKKDRPVWMPEGYKEKLSKKPKKRTEEEYRELFPRYPEKEDGYLVSFHYTQAKEHQEMLSKYGFVVVQLLDAEQCDRTVGEFWEDANRRSKDKKGDTYIPIEKDKPWTWETPNWPSPKKKFLLDTPAFTPSAFANRTDPKLHEVFCHLLGRKDLLCSIDNWGFFRATKGLEFLEPSGELALRDREEWRYSLQLHWDVNPWFLDIVLKKGVPEPFQGLVALVDCPEEVGGFLAVPGSHLYMYDWISERLAPNLAKTSIRPPPDDPMQRYAQKVPLRKGEMVIWYARTLHSNFANYSDKMRIVQYIRCLPATKECIELDRYNPIRVRRHNSEDKFTDWSLPFLTPLGRKMTGLEDWNES